MLQNKKFLKFLQLSLFLVSLESMYAWFLIGKDIIVYFLAIISFLLLYFNSPRTFRKQHSFFIPILLYIALRILVADFTSVSSILGIFPRVFIFAFLVLLRDEYKIEFFNYFTKAFSSILLITLCFWFINLIFHFLPHFLFFPHDDDGGSLYNYYFFMTRSNLEIFPRFTSIFLESGHLGMISSFVLFINGFNLKRASVLIIFISTIFTFSLAAYVLCLFGYIASQAVKSNNLNTFFISFFLIAFLYFVGIVYNNGDNLLNNLIIERLQIEDGTLSGWNRTLDKVDDYYAYFLKSDDKFFGIGLSEYLDLFEGKHGAGYKVFIIRHGIISTLILLLFYISLTLRYKSKLTLIFLTIYTLSFLQRSYSIWDVQIFLFVSGLPVLYANSHQQK